MRPIKFLSIISLLAALVGSPGFLDAALPSTLNFQGRMRLSSGANVADSNTHVLTLSIYNQATGGTALWSEVQNGVTTTAGLFNVQLGAVSPIALTFSEPYWLGVAFDGDPEMTPRTPLAMSAYAYRAKFAEGLAGSVSITAGDSLGLVFASNLSGGGAGVYGVGFPSSTVSTGVKGIGGGVGVWGESPLASGAGVLASNFGGGAALRLSGTARLEAAPGLSITVASFVSFTAGTNLGGGLSLPYSGAGSTALPQAAFAAGNSGSGNGLSGTGGSGGGASGVYGTLAPGGFGYGVQGEAPATNSANVGVYGRFGSVQPLSTTGLVSSGAGLVGQNEAVGGQGVLGLAVNGTGVYGRGGNYGVYGISPSSYGVWGQSAASGLTIGGVVGNNTGPGSGVVGQANGGTGVYGTSGAGEGVHGDSNSSAAGVHGVSFSNGYGVQGHSNSGTGVYGDSAGGTGTAAVMGMAFGTGSVGVQGYASNGWGASFTGLTGAGLTGTGGPDLLLAGNGRVSATSSTIVMASYVSFAAGSNLGSGLTLPYAGTGATPLLSAAFSVTNTGGGSGIQGWATQPGSLSGGSPDVDSPLSVGVAGRSGVSGSAGVAGYNTDTSGQSTGVLAVGYSLGLYARGVSAATGISAESEYGTAGRFQGNVGIDASASTTAGTGVFARDGGHPGALALDVQGRARFNSGPVSFTSGTTVDFTGATVIGLGGVTAPLNLTGSTVASTLYAYNGFGGTGVYARSTGGSQPALVAEGLGSGPALMASQNGGGIAISATAGSGGVGLAVDGNTGIGVSASAGAGYAVFAQNNSSFYPAVQAIAGTFVGTPGSSIAVYGQARNSTAGIGLFGYNASAAPTFPSSGAAVYGFTDKAGSAGLWGRAQSNGVGVIAEGNLVGLSATATGPGATGALLQGNFTGVSATVTGFSGGSTGVFGAVALGAGSAGVVGMTQGSVRPSTAAGAGVVGVNDGVNGIGVYAKNNGGGGVALVADGLQLAISATASNASGTVFKGSATSNVAAMNMVNNGTGAAIDATRSNGSASPGAAGHFYATGGGNGNGLWADSDDGAALIVTHNNDGTNIQISGSGAGDAIIAGGVDRGFTATAYQYGVSVTAAGAAGVGVYGEADDKKGHGLWALNDNSSADISNGGSALRVQGRVRVAPPGGVFSNPIDPAAGGTAYGYPVPANAGTITFSAGKSGISTYTVSALGGFCSANSVVLLSWVNCPNTMAAPRVEVTAGQFTLRWPSAVSMPANAALNFLIIDLQ